MLAALIFVGSHKNMLFIGVVIANIIIGIVQEIRSKISVDKLTILSEKKINVLRNGKIAEISKDEIVLDDILVLSRGSQIPADCIVCDGNCRVNESLLTGESNLIEKNVGDELLSGSLGAEDVGWGGEGGGADFRRKKTGEQLSPTFFSMRF